MAVATVASNSADHNLRLTGFDDEAASKSVTLILTVVSMAPSLVYASLLPHLFFYLRSLDEISDPDPPTHIVLGFVVAAFSVTKMVLSPVVGWMSNILSLRCLLSFSMLFQTIAAAGFALVRSRWPLVGVYVLLGVAGTNSTICRVYVPRIVHSQTQRTEMLAWLTAGTTFGFIVGPALGAFLALIGCPSKSHWSDFQFNGCTSPGWVGAALGALAMFLTALLPGVSGPARQTTQAVTSTGRSEGEVGSYDHASFSIFLAIASQQLAVVLPFAAIESLTAPICAAAYGWSSKQVGILLSVASFVTLPWPFMLKVLMKSRKTSPRAILLVSMSGQVLALCFLDDFRRPIQGDNVEVFQFIFAVCVYYIFYVIAQTTIFTLFYSLLAEHPRCAVWVGWISSMGSLGRCIWPIVSVRLFGIGDGLVWLTTATTVAMLGPGILLINWRRLGKTNGNDATPQMNVSVLTSEVCVSAMSSASASNLLVASIR